MGYREDEDWLERTLCVSSKKALKYQKQGMLLKGRLDNVRKKRKSAKPTQPYHIQKTALGQMYDHKIFAELYNVSTVDVVHVMRVTITHLHLNSQNEKWAFAQSETTTSQCVIGSGLRDSEAV